MKAIEAITKASALRQNMFSDEQKYDWLMSFEGEVAELMCKGVKTDSTQASENDVYKANGKYYVYRGSEWVELLDKAYPDMETELLMTYPHDYIYVLYLIAMIDYYNKETEQYQNDVTVFEDAKKKAFASFRRNNLPPSRESGFKVM